MKILARMSRCAGLVFVLTLHTSVYAQINSEALVDPRVVEAFVDGVVRPVMLAQHTTSGSFALMKDGRVILAKGYGWQDIDRHIPADAAKTLYRPGSISKLFTWVSVLQLEEQGILDLDEDINAYLRNFQIRDTYPGRPVTLRDCMTHTPGFEDGEFGYLIVEERNKVLSLPEAMKRYQPARVNPPGEIGAYSNYCAALAGLVVENMSGVPFASYVRQHIFDVLEMNDSTFEEPLPSLLADNMAIAYDYSDGRYLARPFELLGNVGPAGALTSTVTDLLKFGDALLNGGAQGTHRILRPETVERMQTTQFTYDDRLRGTGLGPLLMPYGTEHTFGHDGATLAYFSHFGVTPSANLVVAFSFAGPGADLISDSLAVAFYEEFFPHPVNVDQPPKDFDERASQYSGSYIRWRRSFTKFESILKLFYQTKVQPTGDGALMIGDGRYIEIGSRLFRNVDGGDLIAFQLDEQGAVTGFVRDGYPMSLTYRAPFYENKNVTANIVVVSVMVFVTAIVWSLIRWNGIATGNNRRRRVVVAWLGTSILHIAVLVVGAIVILIVGNGDKLDSGIPAYVVAALTLPIAAVLATIYLAFCTYRVWTEALLGNTVIRFLYTATLVCALYLSFLYYHWKILGFHFN